MTPIIVQLVGLSLMIALVIFIALGDRKARREREEEERQDRDE